MQLLISAPFGLPHSTFHEEIRIGDRIVPKGHTIQANMAGIMKSERGGWGKDALEFRPERHLGLDRICSLVMVEEIESSFCECVKEMRVGNID